MNLLTAGNRLLESEISGHLKLKFYSSISCDMRIITFTAIVADYFMNNNRPARVLTEDPKDKPLNLSVLIKEFVEMFKGCVKGRRNSSPIATFQWHRLISSVTVLKRKL